MVFLSSLQCTTRHQVHCTSAKKVLDWICGCIIIEFEILGYEESKHTIEEMSHQDDELLKLVSQERDALARELELVRKDANDKRKIYENKIQSLEIDLESFRVTLAGREQELLEIKRELVREKGISKASQGRADSLQRQLDLILESYSKLTFIIL